MQIHNGGDVDDLIFQDSWIISERYCLTGAADAAPF